MTSRWSVVLIGCLILGLWGCMNPEPSSRAIAQNPSPVAPMASTPSPVDPRPVNPRPVDPRPVDPRLVTANTRFGFQLFSQIVKRGSDQNLMVSPSSIAIALSMTYNGASGETQKAMAQALHLQDLSLEDLNHANAVLQADLAKADPKVKLAIANALWGKQGFTFKPDFLQRNQEFYQAEVDSLDFSSPAAVARINAWVKQKTAGKIPEIVREIEPSQVLFLMNAVYFKGDWTKQFDPKLTSDRPFTLPDQTQKPVPMMTQRGDYRYADTDQFQAISLPYGDGRLSLYVFLPKTNLSEFTATLTEEHWNTWMTQFAKQPGSIQLPRFKFEYSTTLKDALSAIGMGAAFNPSQSDFSGMSAEKVVIDQVQHKTFIEVNEEGTEAAAVTSVGVRTLSAPTAPPFQMVVDRPFFAAIRDNQTGTLLFMGTVTEP
jgi:serine protease inhibitor